MKAIKVKTESSQHQLPKPRKDSDKLSPSTASPHSPANISTNKFKSCEDLWASNYDLQDLDKLAQSVCAIQGSQEEMKARFDRMVEFLAAQISRNNEENKRLAEEAVRLGREVKECSQDIKVIEALMTPKAKERGVHEDISLQKSHSRISNSSASRRMLLSSRSNQRLFASKRISGKLFTSKQKL